jgi:hypothetical protein
MADDQEQKTFEIVKLRIAFLQHITTLSGAAILIILALMQRAKPEPDATAFVPLEATIAMFAAAASISVLGLVWLLVMEHRSLWVHPRGSHGKYATFLAANTFAAGVLFAALSAVGVSERSFQLSLLFLAGLAVVVFVLLRLLKHILDSRGRWS